MQINIEAHRCDKTTVKSMLFKNRKSQNSDKKIKLMRLTAFLGTPGELGVGLDGRNGREAAAGGGVGGGARSELGAELEAGVDGRVGEQVEALGHARTGAGGGVEAVAHRLHLLLDAAASLLELGRLHGGGPPPRAFAGLGVRVDHPPGRLSRPLVLHPHEPVVQRKVVPDRVLQQETQTN